MLDFKTAPAILKHVSPAIIEQAQHIVKEEGAYVDNKADAGGATNHGVSLAFARSQTYHDEDGVLRKTFDFERKGYVDVRDIKEITVEQAVETFIVCFFVDAGLGNFPIALQPAAFDTSVNGGPERAIRLAQATVNVLRGSYPAVAAATPALKVDGALGSKTALGLMFAAAHVSAADLVNTFCTRRCNDYRQIVEAEPRDAEFLNGWLRRADSYRI